MKETIYCDFCLKEIKGEEKFDVGGQTLCEECMVLYTVVCDDCGERFLRRDDQAPSRHLCPDCFESYNTCGRCGAVIHDDDCFYLDSYGDEPLCEECYEIMRNRATIHDYAYRPNPIFYGDGPRYMGVELEIDCGGESYENARAFLNVANEEDVHIYCKHDGSLDDGFEIVTHPMSLDYHMKHMPWKRLLKEMVSYSYLSHQAGTCGLHAHVSRSALGDTYEEQEATIARLLFFFEMHWNELLRFSRRTSDQLRRWANRYGYKEELSELLDYAKKTNGTARYCCINLQNSNTVEFRIFRGTLRYNTLIATLQLVDYICEVARYLSDDEIKNLSWSAFVSGCRYPELVQYLKERRLYVNDTINGEEEF